MTQLTKDWKKKAEKLLLNRKIVSLRWITTNEAEAMGWWHRPIVLKLDDGNYIMPQSDDEGNDGGALWVHGADGDADNVMPVIALNDIQVGEEDAE